MRAGATSTSQDREVVKNIFDDPRNKKAPYECRRLLDFATNYGRSIPRRSKNSSYSSVRPFSIHSEIVCAARTLRSSLT